MQSFTKDKDKFMYFFMAIRVDHLKAILLMNGGVSNSSKWCESMVNTDLSKE